MRPGMHSTPVIWETAIKESLKTSIAVLKVRLTYWTSGCLSFNKYLAQPVSLTTLIGGKVAVEKIKSNRSSTVERYRLLVGSLSAGIG
jgi:hypothetical protein